VFPQIRYIGLASVLGLAAASGIAQDWSVGATYGAVNDVAGGLRLGNFHPHDASGWADYRLEPHVLLRASYVTMQATNADAERLGINAVTLGVSYTAFEGFYTSGFFAGIGGYHIRTRATSTALTTSTDQKETAFGFHAGVDGDFKIVKHVSAVGRLTFHGVPSSKRWLLVASAGLAIHL
jgi:hypothetical protein